MIKWDGVERSWSRPRVALLVGGSILVVLAVLWYPHVFAHERKYVAVLAVMGVGAAVGGWLWQRPLVRRPWSWLKAYFHLSKWSFLLLYFAFPLGVLTKLAAGDGPLARYPYWAVVCWLLSIVCVLLIGREQNPPVEALGSETNSSYREIGVVVLLFVLALLLRATALDTFPNTVSGDEGSSGLAAVAFSQGTFDNLFVTGWFSFPSFYFVVQNIGILIWGQTETGLRIMSAVAGALTVPLLYGLVRQMVDRLTAVIAAALLAAAHHHVHFSRIGLNNIWDGLFVTAVLLTFWQGWQSGRRRWFVISGAVLGFSQYFYGSMRIVPLIILVWAAVAFVVQNGRLRQLFPEFVLMAYASLIVYLPLALHFVDHPDVFSAPLTRVAIFGEWIENEAVIRQTTTTAVYLTQLERSAAGIFLEPLRMWYTPHEPLLLPLGAILFVIGLLMSLRRPSLQVLLLFLVIVGNVFTMSLTNDVPAAQRYMLVPPMVMVFVALPLGRLEPYLRQKPAFGRYGPLFITAMVTVILMAINLNFYFFTVYEDFVLGGPNTEVATKLAYYLTEQELDELTVHFAGLPRMSFNSHSTLPFLVPQATGRDIDPPLTEPPQEPLSGRNVFVFLPERMDELSLVVQAYPGGAYQEVFDGQQKLLFSLYVVDR